VRRRGSRVQPLLLGAPVLCAAACAPQPNHVALPPPAQPGPIAGKLLDSRQRPFPDQIVAIGGEKTTSDGDGRFSFPVIPAGYDLVIASPDGSAATVYQGLTRRDPMVHHDVARPHEPARQAVVVATLAGSEGAGERWWVQFAAPGVPLADVRLGPAAAGAPRERGTITVKWEGADTINGVVMAEATRVENFDVTLALFARKDLTLHDGETANVELVPARAPIVKRPRPRVITPKEDPGFDPTYVDGYQVPGVGGRVIGPGRKRKSYAIQDLRGFGLELCAVASLGNPFVRTRRSQCGLDPTASLSIALPSPPAFTAPPIEMAAGPDTRFAWSAVPNGVYRLVLPGGSPSQPSITVVTAQTSVGWPDLQGVGVAFPTPLTTYVAVVSVSGPYASIDELAGGRGPGAAPRLDSWSADSQDFRIGVRPPLGKEEAACKFPEKVVCDGGGFQLTPINRKIQFFPEFAAKVRIHCVRDCAGARVWTKAYAEYSAAHLGFDARQPAPPEEPEPWPPPDVFDHGRGD